LGIWYQVSFIGQMPLGDAQASTSTHY